MWISMVFAGAAIKRKGGDFSALTPAVIMFNQYINNILKGGSNDVRIFIYRTDSTKFRDGGL